MTTDTKDCDIKTMSVPAAGKLYFGLGRNGSYEAAKRGEIPVIKVGARLRAGDRDGAEALGRQMKRSQGTRTLTKAVPAKADVKVIRTTFFRNKNAATLTAGEMSLEELRDLILGTNAATKDKLPWLKLATFGDKRSEKGSLRHDANVVSVSGIEADYDDEEMPFEKATKIVEAARL